MVYVESPGKQETDEKFGRLWFATKLRFGCHTPWIGNIRPPTRSLSGNSYLHRPSFHEIQRPVKGTVIICIPIRFLCT